MFNGSRHPNEIIRRLDSVILDAFGRFRVSEPSAIFATKFLTANSTSELFWDDVTTSGAASSTFNANRASNTLAVSAGGGAGTRVRQSKRRLNYQPGKSQLILCTFVLGAEVANVTKRVGYFDENDGIFLEQTSAGLFLVRRSNATGTPVDTRVAQSDWALDKMDGGGISAINLDPTKTQILVINFEWLGVGRVGVGFNIDGKTFLAHVFNNANNLDAVYMSNPNLPVRYEISSSSAATASLECICCSIISEGGVDPVRFTYWGGRRENPLTANNNTLVYPVLAARRRSGRSAIDVGVAGASLMCTSTASFRAALILNPTLVGASAFNFTQVPHPNSAVELSINTPNTVTVSGGIVLSEAYSQAQATGELAIRNDDAFRFGSTVAGVEDILVLAAQQVVGNGETYFGSMGFTDYL